jgi:hypothetical protein
MWYNSPTTITGSNVINDDSSSDSINNGIRSMKLNTAKNITSFGKLKSGMPGAFSRRKEEREKNVSSPFQEYIETRRSGPSKDERDSLYSTTDDDNGIPKQTLPIDIPRSSLSHIKTGKIEHGSDDDEEEEIYNEKQQKNPHHSITDQIDIDSQLMPPPQRPYFCYMMVTFSHREKINTYIGKSRDPFDKVRQHNDKNGRQGNKQQSSHNNQSDISSIETSDIDDKRIYESETSSPFSKQQQQKEMIPSSPNTNTDNYSENRRRQQQQQQDAGKWKLEMIIGPFEDQKKAIEFKELWRKKSRGIKSRRARGIDLAKEEDKTTWDCRIELPTILL